MKKMTVKHPVVKHRIFWLAMAVAGVVMCLKILAPDATADGRPYSVSLNSPAAFPVDI